MPRPREKLIVDPSWSRVTELIKTKGETHSLYTRASLIHVQEKLGSGLVGAEVGVLGGELSEDILDFMKPSKLYLIDPWKLYGTFKKELEYAYKEDDHLSSYLKMTKWDYLYEFVKDKFKDNKIVEVIRKMSHEAAWGFPDESLDWAYIDGSHTKEYVFMDLYSWWPKIKKGGVLCGHDYLFPEVEAALAQWEKDTGIEVFPYGSDWWINKETK